MSLPPGLSPHRNGEASAAGARVRADLGAFFAPEPDVPPRVPRGETLVVHMVCAGNICRSPAAEALLRVALQTAGVDATVSSSGLAALGGHPADAQVQRLAAERGVDLSRHRARLFERAFAEEADLTLTATRAQSAAVLGIAPAATQRTFPLAVFAAVARDTGAAAGARALIAEASVGRQVRPTTQDDDIPDPYRKDERAHRDAFERISRAVAEVAEALAGVAEGRRRA